MINVERVNFTIPHELKKKLTSLVEPRKQSAFVSSAIKEKIEQIENEKLRQELIEGYAATRKERMKEIEAWQAAGLKTWDE
jgi:metal-responsive CopG/Arc/MetJ family transcriptional regulator